MGWPLLIGYPHAVANYRANEWGSRTLKVQMCFLVGTCRASNNRLLAARERDWWDLRSDA